MTTKQLRLTTPHGDLKHAEHGFSRSVSTQAHYPSWGSETEISDDGLAYYVDSLPLMGI